jgi:hypothetical protein
MGMNLSLGLSKGLRQPEFRALGCIRLSAFYFKLSGKLPQLPKAVEQIAARRLLRAAGYWVAAPAGTLPTLVRGRRTNWRYGALEARPR